MWLNVLTMLRRGGWLLAALLLAGAAQATTFNFNGGGVVPTCPLVGTTYTCTALPNNADTDVIIIASGYTVEVNTAVNFAYNQGLQMSGTAALVTKGSNNLNIADMNPSNMSVTGGTLTAGGNFKIGNQAQTIVANVNAATMTIGSGSNTKITGTLNASGQIDLGSHATIVGPVTATVVTSVSPVTLTGDVNASTSFQLASGSTLKGNLTSPKVTLDPSSVTVTGNIAAATSLSIGSGNTVTGKVTGGALTMASSNAVINGSVTMTGDVDLGSNGVINGDLVARNVNTHASNAVINGNAAVNAIYIDWNNSVTKTITCTGPGASGCSCVTKADPNYNPTCGAASAGVPHHFQINHSGTALTCQPQTVTVIACANAACSAQFTSNVNVTLQPGGQTFTISGGTNSAATVQAKDPGTYTLSASASGVSNATTCTNSGSGAACAMDFKTSGLTVSGTNHVSMTSGALVTIQALTASAGNQSCVPLVTNQTVNIDMSCTYSDPVNAASVPVKIGTVNATCGNGTAGTSVAVPFSFNSSGLATAALQYAEVGKVGLDASYVTSSFRTTGSGSFIAAPARLLLKAVARTTIGPAALPAPPTSVFGSAGVPFDLFVVAINNNDTPTTNFGKESSPAQANIAYSVVNPSDAGNGGLLAVGPFAYSTADKAPKASATFSDVGAIKLTPTLVGTYYMGYQAASFQTTGPPQYIARFVPDHFDTVLLTNAEIPSAIANRRTMSCSPNGQALAPGINPCAGTSTSFTHSAQPFFMKVLAYNGATPPAQTSNYAGSLSKVITVSAMTANGGSSTNSTGAIGWSGETPPATAARFAFAAGTGTLVSPGPGNDNLPFFKFAAFYPASDTVPATIYLRATDSDGVSSQRSSNPTTTSVEAPLSVVSGRLLVANAYGSPSAPLPVQVRAQYYMPGGYVFNPQVNGSGSGPAANTYTFQNCQKALDRGSNACPGTDVLRFYSTSALLTLTNGTGLFRLAATLNGIGSVDVRLGYSKPDGTPVDLFPYLPSTTGRETFGVYRSGPVIYTREVYN